MNEPPKKVIHAEILAFTEEVNGSTGRTYKRYAIRDIKTNELLIVSVMPDWKCSIQTGTRAYIELKYVDAYKHGWYDSEGVMQPYKYTNTYFHTSVELTKKVNNMEVEIGKLVMS